jgi:hypothetical protein
MASSTIKPMPQTIEAYKNLAQRDLELIEEQQREIGQLKVKNNQLRQKLTKGMKYSKQMMKQYKLSKLTTTEDYKQ